MRILIVEDDTEELAHIQNAFDDVDVVTSAANLRDAVEKLAASWPDLIISDAVFPLKEFPNPSLYLKFNVGSLLEKLPEMKPAGKKIPEVILVSGATEAAEHFGKIESWLDDGRLFGVVPKGGFSSWPFFCAVLKHKVATLRNNAPWRKVMEDAVGAYREMAEHDIITQHPVMARAWEVIKKHAEPPMHNSSLYIYGETGTGKELFARALAALKGCESKPYNCNRPENVLGIEMFGTEPDRFSGVRRTSGEIELAGDGVLILDQFCSIAHKTQFELLRALGSTRDYRVVGGGGDLKRVKCKFVISDTISPEAALDASSDPGATKAIGVEMFSRLASACIEIPPLRERRTDIPVLTKSFLDRFNAEWNKSVHVDPEVIARFSDGPWPGNVRELQSVVMDLVTYGSGTLDWGDVRNIVRAPVLEHALGAVASVAVPVEAGWVSGARRLGVPDEADLLSRLAQVLPAAAADDLENFSIALKSRNSNDPGRHLFYGALLVIAQEGRSFSSTDLRNALKISGGQVSNLCQALEGFLKSFPALGVCTRDTAKNSYSFVAH